MPLTNKLPNKLKWTLLKVLSDLLASSPMLAWKITPTEKRMIGISQGKDPFLFVNVEQIASSNNEKHTETFEG